MQDIAISVKNISKAYRIWRDPSARLKAPLWDILGKLLPNRLLNLNSRLKLRAGNPARYYKDFYALKNISFEVKKGESYAIIGRNGSGKSTLLQIITGTLTPTSGTIVTKGRIAALLELGSGFNPDFTGRENVYLNASVLGLTKAEIDARYDDITAFADIGDFINQPVKTYSSGMTMRLAFSVLTAIEPDILIVDEALAVGDIFFVQKCMDRIRLLKSRGCTLLFVSHSMGTVIELCENAALLKIGNLEFTGDAKTAVDLYDYERVAESTSTATEITSAPQPEINIDGSKLIIKCHQEGLLNIDGKAATESESKLVFARIFDAEGVERSLVQTDSSIYLVLGFIPASQMQDPAVGFKIRDVRGQVIYETSSHALGMSLPLGKAQKLYTSGFFLNLPLAPGEYTISVGLANGRVGTNDYQKILLYQHDIKRIEICRSTSRTNNWAGICNLNPTTLLPVTQ
jgi:lipopolysaccharide transport system ATP-binding protein